MATATSAGHVMEGFTFPTSGYLRTSSICGYASPTRQRGIEMRNDYVPVDVVRATGLTSWPQRGSDNAGLITAVWAGPHGALVDLSYEAQDSLWIICVNGNGTPVDALTSAAAAWASAVDVAHVNGCWRLVRIGDREIQYGEPV